MIKKLKRKLAWKLHCWADRLAPDDAYRLMGYSFTFEKGRGLRFRDDRKGCRLLYAGKESYEKAWTEADTNWDDPT